MKKTIAAFIIFLIPIIADAKLLKIFNDTNYPLFFEFSNRNCMITLENEFTIQPWKKRYLSFEVTQCHEKTNYPNFYLRIKIVDPALRQGNLLEYTGALSDSPLESMKCTDGSDGFNYYCYRSGAVSRYMNMIYDHESIEIVQWNK